MIGYDNILSETQENSFTHGSDYCLKLQLDPNVSYGHPGNKEKMMTEKPLF